MEGVYSVSCQSWEGKKNQIIKKNQSWDLKVYETFFFLFFQGNTKFRHVIFQNKIFENDFFFFFLQLQKKVEKSLVYIPLTHYMMTIYKTIILLKLSFWKRTNVSIFHFIKKWKFKTITWWLFSNGQWLQFSWE